MSLRSPAPDLTLSTKALRAGLGDGAEIVDEFVPAHADAIVAIGEGLGGLVGGEVDLEVGIVAQECRIGDRFVAQLVAGIRGVRNELAQEHIAVRIDRMHHELQELGDFGLELVGLRVAAGLRFRRLGHREFLIPENWSCRRYRCGAGAVKTPKENGRTHGPAVNSTQRLTHRNWGDGGPGSVESSGGLGG